MSVDVRIVISNKPLLCQRGPLLRENAGRLLHVHKCTAKPQRRTIMSGRHLILKRWLLQFTDKMTSRRVLVADWDETITTNDTTMLVADTAYRHKQDLPPFSHFTGIYLDALSKFNAHHQAAHGATSLQLEIDYQMGLRTVELTSINALVHQRIFSGLKSLQFAEAATRIKLRPGFVEFANKLNQQGIPMYILSINWCKTMIEESLRLNGVSGVTVLANDLEFNELQVSTGDFDSKFDIRTGYDKMLQLEKIREAHSDYTIVYVGDSRGDVLPMRTSDTGVIIAGGKAHSYLEAVERLKPGSRLNSGIYEGDWIQIREAWYTLQ